MGKKAFFWLFSFKNLLFSALTLQLSNLTYSNFNIHIWVPFLVLASKTVLVINIKLKEAAVN